MVLPRFNAAAIAPAHSATPAAQQYSADVIYPLVMNIHITFTFDVKHQNGF